MTKKSAKNDTLHSLLINKVQALYDIENVIVKALPKMAKAATDEELKAGFEEHLQETEEHVTRLEQVFELLGEKIKKLSVEGIRGIVADGEWVIKNVQGDAVLDANLIAAAQYVEHYEITGYGSAKAWAEEMGHTEIAELLNATLEEEKGADEKLNDLALTKINAAANEMETEEEEEDMGEIKEKMSDDEE